MRLKQGEGGDARESEGGHKTATAGKGNREGREEGKSRGGGRTGMDVGREIDKVKDEDLTGVGEARLIDERAQSWADGLEAEAGAMGGYV